MKICMWCLKERIDLGMVEGGDTFEILDWCDNECPGFDIKEVPAS